MEIKELEQLKRKIEDAKTKRAQAEGALAQIKKTMMERYGVDDIAAAETLLEKMKETLRFDEEKLEEIMEQIKAIIGDNK